MLPARSNGPTHLEAPDIKYAVVEPVCERARALEAQNHERQADHENGDRDRRCDDGRALSSGASLALGVVAHIASRALVELASAAPAKHVQNHASLSQAARGVISPRTHRGLAAQVNLTRVDGLLAIPA